MKTLLMNNGQKIPILGFGTWQLQGKECELAIETALEVGYRHIDTAEEYHNQKDIGRVLQASQIRRDELFITSKAWRSNLHKDDLKTACLKTLEDLKTEYLDLYLIHWPNPEIELSETMEGMENLRKEGFIRSYGVSNFTIHHLQDVLKTDGNIAVNQVEFHPSLNQEELKAFCDEYEIVITAYSPVAQGQDIKLDLIRELSEKYERPPSQIILNWILQKNMVAIPRSSNPDHIKENFGALDWNLGNADIEKIDQLNRDNRIVDPEFGAFDY